MTLGMSEKWGFRADWWRNQRGEYWVLGQTILGVALLNGAMNQRGTGTF